MIKYLLTAGLLCSIILTYGQQKDTYFLAGILENREDHAALEYASVSVLSAIDSSLVNGGITNDEGQFRFEVSKGSYVLKYQYLSFVTLYDQVTVNEPSEKVINLGVIGLALDQKQLNEVVVIGQKDQLEFSLDKRIFNVADNVSNIGKNASDILDNIPSVQVDIEGNVSLRGNNSVSILVDGKPSGLAGISSTDALRQLQGSMIDRIEVVTNPSARYDAEGTAGIINIILKKDAKKGINGSFNIDAGYPANYNGALNMNYRSGNFNFFVSTGLNYRRNNGYGFSRQEFMTENPHNTVRDRTHDRGGLSENFRFGSDYFFNEKSVLTAAMLIRTSKESNHTNIDYQDSDLDNVLYDHQIRKDHEIDTEANYEFSLNYKKEFDRKNHSLTFFSQYRDNGEKEQSDIVQRYIIQDSVSLQYVNNKETEKNLLLQVDYVHPFGENSKFETGFKSNTRLITNDYLVENDVNNVRVALTNFSSNFAYDENIYAAYGIYGNKINRVSFQTGLRVELTDIKTNLITTNQINYKNYYNFFPSLHFTYEIMKDRDLQISYSRRMQRPRFRLLNPFSSFSDNRNIRTGNPDLNPELTDAYEIGYLMNWDNASIYGGVYYNNSTNVIQRISQYVESDEGNYIVTQPFNLATRDSYGIELTVSKEFNNWFKANGSFNFFRSMTNGAATFGDQTINLSADTKSWSARVNTNFKLPSEINLQINGNYRGPQNETQGKRLGFYTIDIGLNRDMLKKKATLTASVQDLFNTRKYRNTTYTDTYIESSVFQWQKRQIRLSFIYRINQKAKSKSGGQSEGNDGMGGDSDF